MDYNESGIFTRTTLTPGGVGSGGAAVASDPATIYSGKVDAQVNTREQEVRSGIQTDKGSSRVFFPVSVVSLGLRPGDSATLNNGAELTGRVDQVDDTDDSCLVLHD